MEVDNKVLDKTSRKHYEHYTTAVLMTGPKMWPQGALVGRHQVCHWPALSASLNPSKNGSEFNPELNSHSRLKLYGSQVPYDWLVDFMTSV